MGRRAGARSLVLLAVLVLSSLLVSAGPAGAASLVTRYRTDPLPGVRVQGLRDPVAPLSVDVGLVTSGSPVHLEVVRAGDAAAGDIARLETPSEACRRVGGIICVNGDFAECTGCPAPLGGVVHDGVLERSPLPDHPQLQLGPSLIAAGPLGLGATLLATATFTGTDGSSRVEKATLPLDAVNRTRGADQVVLFTPAWSGSTQTVAGGDEALLGGGPARLGADVPVLPRALWPGAGSTPIPPDGMVLSAEGAGTGRLQAFWAVATDPLATRRSVVLQPRSTVARVEESLGGHPVILAGGQTLIAASTDPFATNPNPRTMVGWNGAGDLWLVTVDGRQPGHSQGVSLTEGADLLRQLGATDGFNLDGGGSTTFVSLPPGGRTPLVLNRPSDGAERRLTNFLAVVPNDPGAVRCSGAGAVRDAASTAVAARSADSNGYRMVASDGGIFAFGDARFYGSPAGCGVNGSVVGMAPTPSGGGYWLAGSDGGVFGYGDAGFFGSVGGRSLNRPVVGMAPSPTGRGYWLVASDGGIFAFGDARFSGSTGSATLNRPVVGVEATPTGRGYWLVASDGGIFAFGDARFSGSTGSLTLNAPIVGMAARANGAGYWLVAADGGIFAFGGAPFLGSTGGVRLNQPIVGMSRTR